MKQSISHGPRTYYLYGVHYSGQVAYYSTSYRHTVTPEFDTILVEYDRKGEEIKRRSFLDMHPRSVGVTKSNGWSINPEELHARMDD